MANPDLTVVPDVTPGPSDHVARNFTEVSMFGPEGSDQNVAIPYAVVAELGLSRTDLMVTLGAAINPFASLLPDGRGFAIFVEADNITISGLIEAAAPTTAVVDDGRPCHTDIFLGQQVAECPDHYDKKDAIQNWLEGDWAGALEYLSLKTANKLAEG